MSQTDEAIRTYIVQEFLRGQAPDELEGTTYLIEEEILDSLGIFSLVSFIEERFSVTISEEEVTIDNFETLDAICDLVNSKLEGA
jgi:acyl carrier protein